MESGGVMLFTAQQIQTIREQALGMDKRRQVTPEVLAAIYDHRLFHLFVPDELEGRMTSLPEAARIFQESARIDGNLGWLVTIGAGGGFFAALMSREVSRRVFAHREAVIAGSGMPTGTARQVDGGYIVNGSWKYCSGSTYATTFTANAVIEPASTVQDAADVPNADQDESHIRSFILNPDQIEILEDWNAFGLRATASHTISAVEAFVPVEMTFSLTEIQAYENETIYQYPSCRLPKYLLLASQRASPSISLRPRNRLRHSEEALLMCSASWRSVRLLWSYLFRIFIKRWKAHGRSCCVMVKYQMQRK